MKINLSKIRLIKKSFKAGILTCIVVAICSTVNAQSFLNPTFNGTYTGWGTDTPDDWYWVPYTDPICLADTTFSATPNLAGTMGSSIGGAGTPYAGTYFVSGLFCNGNPYSYFKQYQEGIKQTVSGFTIGNSYDITFFQSVIKQSNCIDRQGSWIIYADSVLLGISTPSYGSQSPGSLLNTWDPRSVNLVAFDTVHTIKFLPIDNDLIYGPPSTTDTLAGLRMGIDSVNIIPGPPCVPAAPDFGPDVLLCPGDTILLDAYAPNASYYWYNGDTTQTFTVTEPGYYWVNTTDACGTRSDIIKVEYTYWPDLGNDTTICDGNSVTLDALAYDAGYLWNTGETTPFIEITQDGLYYVDVTNFCGTFTDSMYLTVNPTPDIELGNDTTICPGSSITLDITTPGATYYSYHYQGWQFTPTLTANATGLIVAYIGMNSCEDIDSLYLTVETFNDILPSDTTICTGDSLVITSGLTPPQDFSYLWSTGDTTNFITVNGAAFESIEVTSPMGCQHFDSISVSVDSIPDFFISPGSLCNNQLANINVLNLNPSLYDHLWSTGETTVGNIQVDSAGWYYLTLTSMYGCSKTDSMEIIADPYPELSLPNDTILCENNSLFIDLNDPTMYWTKWNGSIISPTINITQAGTYTVEVATYANCMYYDTIVVSFDTNPYALLNTYTLCPDDTITLIPQNINFNDYSFEWSTGATSDSIEVSSTGTVILAMTSINNCTSYDTTAIVDDSYPGIVLSEDTLSCFYEPLDLSISSTGLSSIIWNDTIIGSTITVNNTGTNWVEGVSSAGCVYFDTINVITEDINDLVTVVSDTTLYATQDTVMYQWMDCNSTLLIPGESAQLYYPQLNGEYAVILTGNYCVDTSACYSISTIGLTESLLDQISISVNQVNDVILISNVPEGEPFFIELYDTYGKLVYQGRDQNEVRTDHFASGIYYLKIGIRNTFITKKVRLSN